MEIHLSDDDSIEYAAVFDAERWKVPSAHIMYVIDVTWKDGKTSKVKRSYQQFSNMHMSLLEEFPVSCDQKRIIPYLPAKSLFRESFYASKKRLNEISDYCQKLISLPKNISTHPIVLEFFEPNEAEVERLPKESQTALNALERLNKFFKRKEKPKDDPPQAKFEVTLPMQLESYTAISSFEADSSNQLSIVKGDVVEVVQKNKNGWWLVQNGDNENGWVPGGFLQMVDSNDLEDCTTNSVTLHQVLGSYRKRNSSELSLEKDDIVRVVEKSECGWYYAEKRGDFGWVPNTFLGPGKRKLFKNSVSGEEVKIGTVLFDYEKKTNDGISLRKNEKLVVLDDTDAAWWLVKCRGKIGLAPRSYLVRNYKPKSLKKKKIKQLKEDLNSQIWFQNITRKEAEEIVIRNKINNGFVVRPSRAGGDRNPYSVTLIHCGHVFNFHIRRRLEDGYYATGVYKRNEKKFFSVQHLVEFHKNHKLVVDGKEIMFAD